jgi:hypothetical protein
MPHPDFNPPGKPPKLTGRKSTLTGLFITTLTPYIEPTDAEVDEALSILGMSRGNCRCAYCGNTKTEWDHFRPVVRNRAPTGYITEIANLVPACAKCNQSKSGSDWKKWMLGNAVHSPKRRGVPDLMQRVARLEAFESWRTPTRIDYPVIANSERWEKHQNYLSSVLAILAEAEVHAKELREYVEQSLRKQRDAR